MHVAIIIETTMALFGITGAFLLALPAAPGLGFAAFLIANLAGLCFAALNRHWRMLIQQAVFLVSSVVGLWNWSLEPLLRARGVL